MKRRKTLKGSGGLGEVLDKEDSPKLNLKVPGNAVSPMNYLEPKSPGIKGSAKKAQNEPDVAPKSKKTAGQK